MGNLKISNNSGSGVLGLLGIAFIVLKLTGFISWSWLWVTLPFWGGFAFMLLILAIFGIIKLLINKK